MSGDHQHHDHGHHAHGRHSPGPGAHAHHAHGAHDHGPVDFGRAFAIGIALNVAFVLVEAWFGWRSGSLALLADAGHNLSDVGGLVLAWAALAVGRLRPDDRHTYGWRRASILASFGNAVFLLLAMGSLTWEALERLRAPVPIGATTMMLVAGVGVLVNGFTAALFMSGRHRDLNIRGAFLHMAGDALVSVGVVLAGALYLWRGWAWLDPVVTVAIAVVIVAGSWSLFRQSLHLLFDGVPEHIGLPDVRSALESLPGVEAVHDLHVWAMGTSDVALTAHLVADTPAHAGVLRDAARELRRRFGIEHVTLQLEPPDFAADCNRGGHAADD